MSHRGLIELSKRVTAYSLRRFRLDLHNVNGHRHWKNVLKNGLDIQAMEGKEIDRVVLLLFSLLHDVERLEDGVDPEHGSRAAQLISSLQGDLFTIEPEQLQLLIEACYGHIEGGAHPDYTVRVCWDADHLDMSRFGIPIDLERLQMDAARSIAEKLNQEVAPLVDKAG